MKSTFKLMIASLTLWTALAAAAPAAVKLSVPGQDDSIARACYNSAGLIVPCKRGKPKY